MCKVCHQNIGIPNIINLYVFLFLLKVSIIFSLFLFLLMRSSKIPKVHFTISFFTLIVLCWAVIINGHTLLSVASQSEHLKLSYVPSLIWNCTLQGFGFNLYSYRESREKTAFFPHLLYGFGRFLLPCFLAFLLESHECCNYLFHMETIFFLLTFIISL